MKLILLLALCSIMAVSVCFGADLSICNPGSEITYFPDGALRSCRLSDFYRTGGITCNHYEIISFYRNGALDSCVTTEDVTYGPVSCAKFGWIKLYASGSLQKCTLKGITEIEGKRCNQQEEAWFLENGRLISCTIAPP
jgi:hypothetical protein